MRGYRRPVPAWAQRRKREHEAEREAAFQDRVGNLMGLDDETDEETVARLQAAAAPQAERYTVSREFLTAGRAVFTITGKSHRYTFRILKQEPEAGSQYGPSFFVYVLTGQKPVDETEAGEKQYHSPYSYIGVLDVNTGEVRVTKGCKLNHRHPAVVAVQWTMPRLWAGDVLPAPAAVYHEGRCGRCARPLTDPESIRSGFGPECRQILGIEAKR